jgi:hypothetical protein
VLTWVWRRLWAGMRSAGQRSLVDERACECGEPVRGCLTAEFGSPDQALGVPADRGFGETAVRGAIDEVLDVGKPVRGGEAVVVAGLTPPGLTQWLPRVWHGHLWDGLDR